MGKSKATPIKSPNSNSNSSLLLHPPYFQMISDAISTLKDRTGSSQQAISKLIGEKYKKNLPPTFKKTLSIQLKKFVKSERLIKVKNSYKISSVEKRKLTGKEEGESPRPKEKVGMKTKRLSQVKTPEGLKKSGKIGMMKKKRLSQVKTPEGLKRKNLNVGKSANGRAAKKVRK